MSKKKIISLVCVCALVLTVIGGTLAYLTDKDQAENVFSVGKVDITLSETVEVNNGKTGDDKVVYADRVSTKDGVTTFSGLMPGNTIVKTPVIKNEGTGKAYVRVAVTVNNYLKINAAIDDFYEGQGYTTEQMQAKFDEIFVGWGLDYEKHPIRLSMAKRANEVTDTNNPLLGIDYVRGVSNQYQSGSNGTEYMEGYNYTGNWDEQNKYYRNAFVMGEKLYVFYLELDQNETYKLFDGLTVPIEFDTANLAMFDGLKIGIYADAIQAEGFATAKDAFNALEDQHNIGWWITK